MNNQYGVCQWCLPVTGLDCLDAAAELGLDGIELDYTDQLKTQARQYRQHSLNLGISLPAMGMNVFCGHSYTRPEGKPFFVEQIRIALDIAGETGVKLLQLPAFYASAIRSEEELKCAADCLHAACELAAPRNLLIGTENALPKDRNLHLFDLVGMENFMFYYDTQNLLQMEGLPDDGLLEAMKDRFCEMHVKDCILGTDPIEWVTLGQGETGFREAIQNVRRLHFHGWIHLENDYKGPIRGAEGLSWRDALRQDLTTIKSMMSHGAPAHH